MLYLINYSTAKGSGSNLTQSQIQIPVSLTLKLDGIGGLQVGNIFTIDYLPKLYRDNVYFMITKVNHLKVTQQRLGYRFRGNYGVSYERSFWKGW